MKNRLDEILIAANFTLLIVFSFVFQAELKTPYLKWLILSALVVLLISILMLIWHYFRYPIRKKLYDELSDKSVDKATDGVMALVENLVEPLAEAEVKIELAQRVTSAKNTDELKKISADVKSKAELVTKKMMHMLESAKSSKYENSDEGSAIRKMVASFVENARHENRLNKITAFQKPLDEKQSKLKHLFDIVTFAIRYHVFVIGIVLL